MERLVRQIKQAIFKNILVSRVSDEVCKWMQCQLLRRSMKARQRTLTHWPTIDSRSDILNQRLDLGTERFEGDDFGFAVEVDVVIFGHITVLILQVFFDPTISK